jgi:integrase
MGLPSGDTVFDYRDRAIIKFFLYSGARIGTACRLRVKDFHQDGDEATVTLHEKGDKHRRIGLHFAAAEAIAAYIAKAELSKGPLFRARLNSRSQKLGAAAAVRLGLQLFALASNLANFLRQRALLWPARTWTLTTLREKRIKIGVKVVRHTKAVTFQLARWSCPGRCSRRP